MTRRSLAVVLVVATLLLAGCAGLGGSTGDDGTTTTGAPERSAEDVRDDAVAAMSGVETYRVAAENEVVVSGNIQQQSSQSVTAVFDREARELRTDRTTRVAGRTQRASTWLVDRTIYSRSAAFVQRFGSRWIEVDASENFSRLWKLQDTLGRQRAVLENASTLELAGTATVNGTETHVLRANVTPGDYEDLAAGLFGSAVRDDLNVTIHRADFTFYLDAETDLPVRTEAQINATVPLRGRSIDQNVSMTVDYYGYGDPASIDLPDAADSAVDISNRTGGPLVTGGETPALADGVLATEGGSAVPASGPLPPVSEP